MPYDYQRFQPSIPYNAVEGEETVSRNIAQEVVLEDFPKFREETDFRLSIFDYLNREAKIAGYTSIGDAISLKNSSLTGARAEADKWIQFLDNSLTYYDEKMKNDSFKDLNRETLITSLKTANISPEEPGLTYI